MPAGARWREEGVGSVGGSEVEMGRAAAVVSGAKGKKSEEVKAVALAKSEEKVAGKKGVPKSVVKSEGAGVKQVSKKITKKGGRRRRSRRGAKKAAKVAPLGAAWSTRQWAAVGLMTKATAERPRVTLRELRGWWKAYAPGPVRKDYGVLEKELEELSKGKLVRLSLGGKRARVTATGRALLFG